MLLSGQVILITGAGRGLGRGIAEAVAEAGADVVATDLDQSAVEETARQIEARGRRALARRVDVTDRALIIGAITDAVDAFGRLDGLVNNAGVLEMQTALEVSTASLARQMAVHVDGLLACCQLVARRMMVQGGVGAIVNVASNAGKVGYPNMAAYNASKAAVINLTRSLAAEWAEHRINVNAVCPGGVATPMLRQVANWLAPRLEAAPEDLYDSMTPAQLGRHVQPIEVGRVVAFLLSDAAEIIRGQAINVDGGDTPY